MDLDLRSTLRLNDGVAIPRLGLGVFQAAAGSETRDAVAHALATGWRHVDTARVYRNEKDVGRAIADSGIPRAEVFLTTKLWNDDHGYDRAQRACRESLARLGLDYVDLYLIHWPVAERRRDSWRALAKLKADGLCRAVGVSNYTVRHLEELLGESSLVPAVNQVEMSPFLYQRDLIAFCATHGIVVEAYSPLTKGERLDHPTLAEVGRRHRKTPAQVLIRWALQHDLVVLPKSVRPARIDENAAVFDFALSAEDMATLDALDEGLRTSWDPTDAP